MVATVAGIHLGIDTHANRPAANTVPDGSIYSCSTHGLIYKSNYSGNSWSTWATLGGTETLAATIVDAKGDLIAASAADTPARLPVGANDTILMADSGQSTGLKWVASQTPSTQAFSDAAAEGTADTFARGDHKHGMPASPGGSLTGQPLVMEPPLPVGTYDYSDVSAAGIGFAVPIVVPSSAKIRGLTIFITTAGSGSIQWGLFDYSSNAASATKLAGGSAAPGGTGWSSIAATSAPVSVSPGCYMLVLQNPSSNNSTIKCLHDNLGPDAIIFNQVQNPYTWTDTPDFTSASWTSNVNMPRCYLEGDLNASNNRWT